MLKFKGAMFYQQDLLSPLHSRLTKSNFWYIQLVVVLLCEYSISFMKQMLVKDLAKAINSGNQFPSSGLILVLLFVLTGNLDSNQTKLCEAVVDWIIPLTPI